MIATENDVRVLAGHINTLTRHQNKIARALARHGGDLSSYINQVDDRMDNLMEGINENEVLTKILAAKKRTKPINFKTDFRKWRHYTGNKKKVTVCRTVSWEVVIVNSVIIDRVISPLLIPPKEMERTLNFDQGDLTPVGIKFSDKHLNIIMSSVNFQ